MISYAFLIRQGFFEVCSEFDMTHMNKSIQGYGNLEAEFKEFESQLKLKPGLKYGWFFLKLYSIVQDLSGLSIETDFWGI